MNASNPLADLESERRKRLYRHEFGHAVAAHALGFVTGNITIKISTGGTPPMTLASGGAAIELSESGIANVVPYLQRRISVLYAGILAQSLEEDGSGKFTVNKTASEQDWRNQKIDCKSDYEKVGELIYVLRNVLNPGVPCDDLSVPKRQVEELHVELWSKTTELVNRYADIIVSLAEKTGYVTMYHAQFVGLRGLENITVTKDFDALN